MPLRQQEIRERAQEFAFSWVSATRERSEAQTFWNEFFYVFGISRRRVASFEEPVKKLGDQRGAIDLIWKGTLIVEHKSRGQSLDKAYSQALGYFPGLKEQDLPKYVLVSDFARFRLYDLDEDIHCEFNIEDLPNQIHLFGFISGYTKRVYRDEDPVNIAAAEKMGELHDALSDSGYTGHELEVFLVRLVYCLFADETGIFPKDHFRFFIEEKTREDGMDVGALLEAFFETLDQPPEARQKTLDEDLSVLPYVNGALFRERLRVPSFNADMRRVLLEAASFDWSKVSPAIFGSMFQSVMDCEKRRHLGAHYTAEKNILKVVRGLFLDDLYREYEAIKNDSRKLRRFHQRLGHLKFFDPACGCGNFLIITYRELRRLEIQVLKDLHRLARVDSWVTDVSLLSVIDVDVLYGIEFEEFPVRIAEVAIWLTDHLMNMELSAEFGQTYVRLPLHKSACITHGNALHMEWEKICPKPKGKSTDTTLYILGNPPFVGKHNRTSQQTADIQAICGDLRGAGVLDYVCAWYVKAAHYMQSTRIMAAFVSTNSITQGEQPGVLWQHLFAKGIKITFAHRTFKWSSEARGVAQVYCVIIGFAPFEVPVKHLYDYETPAAEPAEIQAKNINPYLVDADDVLIPTRERPICDVPEILYGCKPNEDGQLLFTDEEKKSFLKKEPKADPYFHQIISAHEFLQGKRRWCLWLKGVSPAQIRSMPEVMKRIEAVRHFRLQSKKAATRQLAELPALFAEIRQPDSDYVLIPCHSSETRRYVPIAFFDKNYIVSNSCTAVPEATPYHFGILTSAMHMTWMRQICGRIKSDYRYSNNLVYNNFPWPENPSKLKQDRVVAIADKVLEIREQFTDAALSDLYSPLTMPESLLRAHRELDVAVDNCYRPSGFRNDLERLTFLFALYRKYTGLPLGIG